MMDAERERLRPAGLPGAAPAARCARPGQREPRRRRFKLGDVLLMAIALGFLLTALALCLAGLLTKN